MPNVDFDRPCDLDRDFAVVFSTLISSKSSSAGTLISTTDSSGKCMPANHIEHI